VFLFLDTWTLSARSPPGCPELEGDTLHCISKNSGVHRSSRLPGSTVSDSRYRVTTNRHPLGCPERESDHATSHLGSNPRLLDSERLDILPRYLPLRLQRVRRVLERELEEALEIYKAKSALVVSKRTEQRKDFFREIVGPGEETY